MRIGHGYDVHRMKEGRPCILCGVTLDYPFGPDGHSDADVAAHALMDAMLGALALGDIGKLFPDTDDRWLGADSMELLKEVNRIIRGKGYQLGNCDITILAQKPKIAPYIPAMRERLAEVLETGMDRISVKATTEEGLGFTGRKEGISAHAVVLLDNSIN
ncbi:MAG: 2-C-methyl-D-erythritol 2,4-cyclodiphosphate synthase [Oscillospiraceae bacterium]|nr:2-C-methyl-D-erythritol 2,4-cyclodiphosphate synthase [Oscillospiraceae bacterium]